MPVPSEIPSTPIAPIAPVTAPTYHGPLDYNKSRTKMYDGVLTALQTKYPIENENYKLELNDLRYDGPEHYSLKEQKQAILSQQSLARPIKGTWNLIDKKTNQPIDSYKSTIINVPYLTQRGTYIVGGSEYTSAHQARLKSGVYSRKKDNGEYEAHVNVLKGGPGFRVFMEPKTGVFRMQIGQAKLRLYPVMRAMGVSDQDMQKRWGSDLFNANMTASDGKGTLDKVWERLADARSKKETGENVDKDFKSLFNKLELDPEVTHRTLGERHDRVTPEALGRITSKLINISKGTEDTDDRDSLAYQETWSAPDMLHERIVKDAGRLSSRLLWRATLRKNLSGMPSAALNPQVESLFFKSGLAQPIEEINSLDSMDQNMRITRLGEGGIGSDESVPEDARAVQPSHFNFIDGVRTPESGSVGIDLRLASGTQIGDDKQLYSKFTNVRTGKPEYLTPLQAIDTPIAFPGELRRAVAEGRTHVKAMKNGRMSFVHTNEVTHEAPTAQGMFTHGSNLVPMASGMKPGRLLMAAKYSLQALPLRDGEAPLVQSVDENGDSYYDKLAEHVGAIHSKFGGQVVAVTKDNISVVGSDGQVQQHELYDNFPMNRKSFITNTPTVKPGDVVQPGQLLARSNMTDAKGTMNMGRNMRVGYMSYKGKNYEDAIVVSESAARKLASEHMYTESMDKENFSETGRNKYMSIFPSSYSKAQLQNIGSDGVVRSGTVVNKGDPLVLSVRQRTSKGAGMLHRSGASDWQDSSRIWDHEFPGLITDRWNDDDGIKVAIKAYAPCEEGDKLAGREANKGVIAAVIPDNQMPVSQDGKPLEVLLSPAGIITRINPNQVVETVLGKIAAKRGQPYKLPTFSDTDWVDYAMAEAKKYGVSDTEDLYDPSIQRTVPGVLTGLQYIQKLSHTAESKGSGRGLGAYTAEGTPTSDDEGNPKRIGLGEMQALVSHGATNIIQEIKTLKGAKNDEYWRKLTMGETPASPEIPQAYKKFTSLLQGAGINIKKRGEHLHLTSMTDKDVEAMSHGEITEPTTVRWMTDYSRGLKGEKALDPVEGGLFDRGITGGHGGCFHGSTTVITDEGELSIQTIVEGRLPISVLSYDWTNREFVYKPVTNWYTNFSEEGIGHAELSTPAHVGCSKFKDQGKTALWGTRQHQVYTVDGTKRDLAASDYLLIQEEILTDTQEQVVLGSILGDAHIAPRGMYSEGHCEKQKDYLLWKYAILRNFCPNPPAARVSYHDYKGKRIYKPQWSFRSKTTNVFTRLRAAFYPEGKKIVNRDLISKLGPLGLAVWYMDDGCISKQKIKNTVYVMLCTHGFTLDDVQYLQSLLADKWSIKARIDRQEKHYAGKAYGWSLHIVGVDAQIFLDIITPYVHPTMLYKLGRRPKVTKCTCGREIWLGRKLCNTCLVDRVKAAGSHKLGKGERRRLGGSKLAREIAAGLTNIPYEVTRCESHDRRIGMCGCQLPSLLSAGSQPRVLRPVASTYYWKTGKHYERTQRVYDIEVADTHNYFANGVLVSNSHFSHITLAEPMPQPAMEDPIRLLIGVTQKQYENIISGKGELQGLGSGGKAIKGALERIQLGPEIERQQELVKSCGSGAERDLAVKKLKYLSTLKANEMSPADLVVSKVPVLPPIFRPITANSKFEMVSGSNLLYMDLMNANKNYKDLSAIAGGEHAGEARLNVYNALKAVTGLGDPIKPERKQQNIQGLLHEVFGNSPKCYDDQTEVLTLNGWMKFKDYHGELPVGTLNPSTDTFEWQLPSDVIHQDYSGKMIHTITNKLDIMVTPNHKHWVRHRQGRGVSTRWTDFCKVEASELEGVVQRVEYKTAASRWSGSTPSYTFSGSTVDPDAFASFVGWWLAEGWNHQDRCTVYIAQAVTSEEQCVTIDAVFSKLGLPFTRKVYIKKKATKFSKAGYQTVYWSINDRSLVNWLTNHIGDGAENKRLSPAILDWEQRHLRLLLTAYLDGDGDHSMVRNTHPENNKTYASRYPLINKVARFSTASMQLPDDLQQLTLKIGLGIQFNQLRISDNPKWLPQRCASVIGRDRVTTEYRPQTMSVDYVGQVHCVTVENGLIFVRRNNKVVVSGNSGTFQRKLLGTATDLSARAVITPNPELNIDQIGIPESQAWKLYGPFVTRRLIRQMGNKPEARAAAIRMVVNKTPAARDVMLKEMEYRPVLSSRAPALHRYSIMAFKPVLNTGKTLQLSPGVTATYNGDFDGDTMNFHVLVSDKAIEEAKQKMLPSANIRAVNDFSAQFAPRHDFVTGLYHATTKRNGKRMLPVYQKAHDVLSAFKRGEVNLDDVVSIKE